MSHLESELEGLQDATHRQDVMHGRRIDELNRRTSPEEMARRLTADARRRGL